MTRSSIGEVGIYEVVHSVLQNRASGHFLGLALERFCFLTSADKEKSWCSDLFLPEDVWFGEGIEQSIPGFLCWEWDAEGLSGLL